MTRNRVINICFHGIGSPARSVDQDESRYWIDPELYVATLDEIAARPDVSISFDDGNISDLHVGLEPLLKRGLTATFFVLAGRLGQAGSLGAIDLRELRRQGMRVGSHGMDHVPWRGLSESSLKSELQVARDALVDASDGSVDQAALPLGRYDRRVLHRLRDLGYQHVYSSDRFPATRDAWLQPRYSLRSGDTINTVRDEILAPPSRRRAARVHAVGLYKRSR